MRNATTDTPCNPATMNSLHPARRPGGFQRLATGALCLLTAGCAQLATQSGTITEAQACASLRQVIAQAGDGFQALRGTATPSYDHTRWDAKPILPRTDCDILSWGGGRTNYACTWDKGDEATARADYAEGLGIVQRCLGADWQTTHPAGQTGQAALLAKPGEPAKVEVRYYQERRPSRNWQTSLTVGPPVTRDAR